jgi:hypothetical protein
MSLGPLLAGLAAGAAVALAWLALLWGSVRLAARLGALWPIGAGLAARLGLLGLAGWGMLAAGAEGPALLAALAGFALARLVVVARVRAAGGEAR